LVAHHHIEPRLTSVSAPLLKERGTTDGANAIVTQLSFKVFRFPRPLALYFSITKIERS